MDDKFSFLEFGNVFIIFRKNVLKISPIRLGDLFWMIINQLLPIAHKYWSLSLVRPEMYLLAAWICESMLRDSSIDLQRSIDICCFVLCGYEPEQHHNLG